MNWEEIREIFLLLGGERPDPLAATLNTWIMDTVHGMARVFEEKESAHR